MMNAVSFATLYVNPAAASTAVKPNRRRTLSKRAGRLSGWASGGGGANAPATSFAAPDETNGSRETKVTLAAPSFAESCWLYRECDTKKKRYNSRAVSFPSRCGPHEKENVGCLPGVGLLSDADRPSGIIMQTLSSSPFRKGPWPT